MVALARTTVIRIGDGTTMADITNGGDMPMAEPSSDKIDTADKNCITRLDGAVDARGTTQSKTVSANLIADTEMLLRSQCRHRDRECPLWVKSRHVQYTKRCPLCANSGH